MKRFFFVVFLLLFSIGFASEDAVQQKEQAIIAKQKEVASLEQNLRTAERNFDISRIDWDACRVQNKWTFCMTEPLYPPIISSACCSTQAQNYLTDKNKVQSLINVLDVKKKELEQLKVDLANMGAGGPFTLNDAFSKIDVANSQSDVGTRFPQYLPGVSDKRFSGNASDVTIFLQRIGRGIVYLAGGVAVFFVVLSGAQMLLAFGKTEKIAKAKKSLYWSIIGLFVIIFAYVVVKTIISFTYSGQEVSFLSSFLG